MSNYNKGSGWPASQARGGADGRARRRSDLPPRGSADDAGEQTVAEAPFVCGHCGRVAPTLASGGRHRNHCPYCLYSRHVDDQRPGDRASDCGALMAPIGVFQRPNGEYVLVHRCLGCGLERFNRIAADDDLPLARSLPTLPPRQAEGAAAKDARPVDTAANGSHREPTNAKDQ